MFGATKKAFEDLNQKVDDLIEIHRKDTTIDLMNDMDKFTAIKNVVNIPHIAPDPMLILTPVLALPGRYGCKWPSFQEAWKHIFEGDDEYCEMHRAYDDALHEAMLIQAMVKRGIYDVNN